MNAHANHVMAALDDRRAALAVNVDDVLRASWLRSVTEHGLEPDRIVEPDVLTHSELVERRAPVEELSALSNPEIDRLYQRLFDHAEVVMLTDAQGVVVHFRSAAAVVDRCSNLRVLPGSIWTEDRQGTTGVGLCLREQKPLSVVMGEHFATKLAALSCTVAPIFGAEGRLAGILNVTSMQSTNHALQAVVRELVASSARRIENLYFDRRHAKARVLRLSRHDDFCDGAAEARLALDDGGRIVDATPLAQRLLASGTTTDGSTHLIGRKLSSVAGVSNVDRLLNNQAPAIEVAQGVVHVRVTDPPRRSISGSSRNPCHGKPMARAAHAVARPARHSPTLEEIIGSDPGMVDRLQRAQRLHARGLPLLLQGESGSGKTQVARALHESGPHQAGGFVAINCAAIPADLIESELFGHRAGAFTGAAKQGSPGRLLSANGGTLFLDEIGDMPFALQARLLQVLSEGEFVPVGAAEPVRVRFALVSASLRDLKMLVREGRFREDLYYRLSGATLILPALRERADRDELVQRAFARAAADADMDGLTLTEPAVRALARHSWPGNLRELQHVAQFAVALSDSSLVDLQSLPPPLGDAGQDASAKLVSDESLRRAASDLDAVADALRRTAWNVSGAAALLGVSRATLHRRLNEFSLKRPGPDETQAGRNGCIPT
jgi:sigma-54 dependent transcriptional regulator, acetoin dehydrogenase operon transcriptional activator AcoR